MANREKKINLGRKQTTASPIPPKDEASDVAELPNDAVNCNASAKTETTKLLPKKKRDPKKVIKKTFKVKLKPKGCKLNSKLGKAILAKNKSGLAVKKTLLKNGVAKTKVIRKKAQKKDDQEDKPPVLEPIFPIEDNKIKKKVVKKGEEGYCSISATIESIINQVSTPKTRKTKLKKDTISESIEEVVQNQIKKEDVQTDDKKKLGGAAKKMKIDLIKKKIKKENIENALSKIDTSNSNVIDMLDLNVSKIKSKKTLVNRRHSIEKFPITSQDVKVRNVSLFGNLPRSISPKAKRIRLRPSLDSKRSSPYTTRSDSPARILRNGKQRKLKHLNLLDGLDSEYKKRRRLCSDYSGSEISVSKLSGYESDSSYSDLASLHENSENVEKKEEFAEPVDSKTDTNSNLCSEEIKSEDVLMDETIAPSFKVPEKSIILGIMKQTFNDVVVDDNSDKKEENVEITELTKEENAEHKDNLEDKRKTRSSSARKNDLDKSSSPVSTSQFYGIEVSDTKEEHPVENGAAESEEIVISFDNLEKLEVEAEQQMNGNFNGDIAKEESPENLAIKNQILQALGLQSLKAAEEARLRKLVPKNDSYTGTLKTVIKLNRYEKKKGRNALKMTLQKKTKTTHSKDDELIRIEEDEYKIMKEGNSASWKSHHGSQSSDTAGALRKSHYSNRSNMDGSSEHTSDGDTNTNEEGKLLVIPEKASSFSIHPGRLCKDECSYCFGKFGLFDTPCHIAQMKSVERQNKILAAEKHLTRDSCLCDACYRHVDRKSNTPSYSNKSVKRNTIVAPGPRQNHCHVLGCGRAATNILRRKWLIKMRKSVCQVINIDLDNPGLHSIPICEEHYAALEHLMVCAMCKRRLARNHIHYLGPESNDLNTALNEMGIPVKLNDRPVVCKLCRYFASLVLKNPEDRSGNTTNFFVEYRKRLLHFHDIEVMAESQAEEPIPAPMKDTSKSDKDHQLQVKKKKKLSKPQSNLEPPVLVPQVDIEMEEGKSRVPSTDSRAESPSDYMVDFNTLIPNIAIESANDIEATRREISKKSAVSIKRINKPDANSKKIKNKSDIAVQRLGSNPSISVRQLFPGEEDLQISGNIEFHNVKERTPEGWEKCVSTIQFDPEIKMLWNELQKPYGNQSSFLRHLILLEKYFRNGDLVLSPNATHHSVNYTESVQNRLKAYDNIPSNVGPVQPLTMIPFNKPQKNIIKEVIPITTPASAPPPTPVVVVPPVQPPATSTPINQANIPKNIPITVSQLNNSNSFLVPNPAAIAVTTSTPVAITPPVSIRPKLPPGLISLQPGTKIPVTPLVKVPQSQKIKFPITKNWRPNLIPIDPTKKPEKKPGLVQVISGGKPYHITVEDYKKMCAIKRTFDLRKRLQEAQKNTTVSTSILKSLPSRKGLIISKTSTAVSPKTDSNSDQEFDNSLEKLDKTVEKLEAKLNVMPKIPKSLTVIPQTVTKKTSRPSSPTLLTTSKSKPTGKS